MKICIGNDVSKGYADIAFLNEARTVLSESGRFDDTADGHEQVRQCMTRLKEKNNDVEFIVGVEASGGLERNWLKFFRELKNSFNENSFNVKVYLLNAFAVKKFSERNLKRNTTDRISARNIAEYLFSGGRRKDFEFEPQMQGARTLYGCINSTIGRRVQIQCQLQSLLVAVQPELVQYCRDGIPEWVINLLTVYPTATQLAKARIKSLSKINSITSSRAKTLIEAAQKTVASQIDEQTAEAVSFLAKEIKEQNLKISDLQQSLIQSLKNDSAVQLIDSIKGLGIWTSIVMRLEYGNMERFYSPEAAVAYAGLDPRLEESGDQVHNCGISHAGRIRIRAALYMPTLAAIRFNPIIRNLYNRLIAAGKPEKLAITACMRKMIHLIYACWITGKPFNANYQSRYVKKVEKENKGMQPLASIIASLSAPISKQEAKRRKAAAMPQKDIPLMRGPSAASTNDNRKISD